MLRTCFILAPPSLSSSPGCGSRPRLLQSSLLPGAPPHAQQPDDLRTTPAASPLLQGRAPSPSSEVPSLFEAACQHVCLPSPSAPGRRCLVQVPTSLGLWACSLLPTAERRAASPLPQPRPLVLLLGPGEARFPPPALWCPRLLHHWLSPGDLDDTHSPCTLINSSRQPSLQAAPASFPAHPQGL